MNDGQGKEETRRKRVCVEEVTAGSCGGGGAVERVVKAKSKWVGGRSKGRE